MEFIEFIIILKTLQILEKSYRGTVEGVFGTSNLLIIYQMLILPFSLRACLCNWWVLLYCLGMAHTRMPTPSNPESLL